MGLGDPIFFAHEFPLKGPTGRFLATDFVIVGVNFFDKNKNF